MPRASGTSGDSVTTQEAIFTASADGGPCVAFAVRCQAGSSNPAAVNIPQLHGALKVLVPIGETVHFRCGSREKLASTGANGITLVNAEGVGGAATIDYWVAADNV